VLKLAFALSCRCPKWTLVAAKIRTFSVPSAYFSFNRWLDPQTVQMQNLTLIGQNKLQCLLASFLVVNNKKILILEKNILRISKKGQKHYIKEYFFKS
jgi:hypothetical protein